MLNGHVLVAWAGLDRAGPAGEDRAERDLVPGSEAGLVYSRERVSPVAVVLEVADESCGVEPGDQVVTHRRNGDVFERDGLPVQPVPTIKRDEKTGRLLQTHRLAAVWRDGEWLAVGSRVVGRELPLESPSGLLAVEVEACPTVRLLVTSVGPKAAGVEEFDVVRVERDALSRMVWDDAEGQRWSVLDLDVVAVEDAEGDDEGRVASSMPLLAHSGLGALALPCHGLEAQRTSAGSRGGLGGAGDPPCPSERAVGLGQ